MHVTPTGTHGAPPTQISLVPRRLYDVNEASRTLSISRAEMFRMLKSGSIESVKVGRRRLIPAEALDDYVDGLRAKAKSERPA